MSLPVNVDTTYPDDALIPSRKLHQQHHDLIHGAINALTAAYDAAVAAGFVGTLAEWAAILRTPTDGSVTTAKLVDGSVTAAKVAADVATQQELDAETAARIAADDALALALGSAVRPAHGLSWYGGTSATPDAYQALGPTGADAGALAGNTGYARQTTGVPVDPYAQSLMRRCVLANDGASVVYYLDCDDSTKRAGVWLRVHEGVTDPVSPIPGQVTTGTATLRSGVLAYESARTYEPGDRVTNGGSLWECLIVSQGVPPAPGSVAADLTGAGGQVMVEVPRFYVWQAHASARHAWDVLVDPVEVRPFPDLSVASNAPVEHTVNGLTYSVHPAFTKAGVQRSHRYIAAFRAFDNAGILESTSGRTYTASLTRAAFRTRAQARNVGLSDPSGAANDVWHLLDWHLWAAVQMLYLVEYRTFHSQAVLGGGNISGGAYAKTTGRSAPLGNASGNYDAAGTLLAVTTGGTDGVAYRGIEDFYGSMWVWIDGWNASERDYLVSATPAGFADDTAVGYTSVGVASVASASYPTDVRDGLHFVPLTVGGSSATFVPDGHWNSTGWRVACVGGYAGFGAVAGAFAAAADISSAVAGATFGSALAR